MQQPLSLCHHTHGALSQADAVFCDFLKDVFWSWLSNCLRGSEGTFHGSSRSRQGKGVVVRGTPPDLPAAGRDTPVR